MKKAFLYLLLFLALFFVVLLINTFTRSADEVVVEKIDAIHIDAAAITRFSTAIQIPTISFDDPSLIDTSAFVWLRQHIEASFPMVHANLQREIVAKYSLLYKWNGRDNALPPVILMAHMDVVPVEEASRGLWEEEPFSGVVKDGFIWGRGSLDDKNGVFAILEAVEMLLNEGFVPPNDLYLAFGHNEEAGGTGAKATAALLESRNVRAAFVLDEGGIVADGIVPGLENLIALVGTAEKGYVSLELSVNLEGGHASMPPKETSIEVLSRAMVNLRDNPFPPQITAPIEKLLNNISPHVSFLNRVVLSNLWLTEPLVINSYEQSSSGNASIRTTIAPTVFRSGQKENVLPADATAVVNFRILPGETSDYVVEYVRKIINDERVKIRKLPLFQEPTFVSPTDNPEFNALRISAKQVFGDILVSPFLMIGATDARHYSNVSDKIFRFSPMVMTSEDLSRIHGINEKISIENYKNGIRFYYQVVKNLEGN